jgi:hypothetical protein
MRSSLATAIAASRVSGILRLHAGIGGKLPEPKDLHCDKAFIWTSQVTQLVSEVHAAASKRLVQDRLFILAGPSGIGKSNITYLLALDLVAQHVPVLYVPDCGVLLQSLFADRDMGQTIRQQLVRWFCAANRDIPGFTDHVPYLVESCDSHGSESWHRLSDVLSALKAVVVIDEQGMAYNMLMKKFGDTYMFPFLSPTYFLSYPGIRVVFSGSNQAKFESILNGTFTCCLRFVTPFTENEAKLLFQEFRLNHEFSLHQQLANCVPREMTQLSGFGDGNAYVTARSFQMTHVLQQLDTSEAQQRLMVSMLKALFQSCSLGCGTELISFLDLGFVYRVKAPDGLILAHALCHPARLALMNLWTRIDPTSSRHLMDPGLIGEDFEDLVWKMFLQRGFGIGKALHLPCTRLGLVTVHTPLHIKLDAHVMSQAKPETLEADLDHWVQQAHKLGMNILYRCPKGAKSFDFCILTATGDNPDIHFFLDRPRQTGHGVAQKTKPDSVYFHHTEAGETSYHRC